LRLVFVDLYISEYVVHKTGESRCGLGPDKSDGSYERAFHGSLDKSKDVLHAAFDLGLLAVALLLLLSKRMIAVAFLADDRYHSVLDDQIILRLISSVEILRLVV